MTRGTAGALLVLAGLSGLAWAWATSDLLAGRNQEAAGLNWFLPTLALAVGVALIVDSRRRVAFFDLVVALVFAGLVGNAVLWVGLRGWLDGLIGEPSEVSGPTVVVTVPGAISEGAAGLARDAEIQVKIVARHAEANDEESVETVSVDATFVGPSDVQPGDYALTIERGAGDSGLDSFLSAVADAERIVLVPAGASD